MGIFAALGGDFRRFARPKKPNAKGGDSWQNRESPPLAGFSRGPRVALLNTGLDGWRRSADRTCLQPNSLQTGNFSENFAKSGLGRDIKPARNACAAAVSTSIPNADNRETILKNREIDVLSSENPMNPRYGGRDLLEQAERLAESY